MLRRHSTKSKSDLRRRKSTNSVRSVPLKHIDVAAAQRDAKLAAVQAFSRGQDRLSVDMAVFPTQAGIPHHKENSSLAQLSRNDSVTSRDSENDEHVLGRRRSVRFVGPNSGLKSRASRISARDVVSEQKETAPRRSLHRSESVQNIGSSHQTVVHGPHIIQPPDRTSSCGKALAAPKAELSHGYIQSLAPNHQSYTPEDDIASMPSSFRRVRKTRSLFTTRMSASNSEEANQDALLLSTGSEARASQGLPSAPCAHQSILDREKNHNGSLTPGLKAPKSMSFLRSRRGRTSTSAAAQDPVLSFSPTLSKSSSHEHLFRSRILPKPSMFFGPKGGKIGQNMRKTLRQSSSNAALPTSETTTSIHVSMRKKARKVSASLRSRFKNLFVPKSEDDAKLPAQQVEAQKTHVADLFDNHSVGSTAMEAMGFGDRSSVSRVSCRIPSLHAVPSSEQLRSRRGSIDSLGGEARRMSDDKSRVTSWSSTEGATIVTHRPQEKVEVSEHQRLSAITEHGAQAPVPSSISRRAKLGLQTITSQEELVAPCSIMERLPPGTMVDSQRVYSALMKKMSETQQHFAELVEEERKSSGHSDPFRTLSPPTSEDSSDSDVPAAYPHDHLQTDGLQDSSRSSSSAQGIAHGVEANDRRSLAPPVHLTPGGADFSSKPIADRSSAFFGSPTSHLFRTRSPWRRSLQETIQQGLASCDDITESVGPTSATRVCDDKADSASNYSQDTQIHNLEMKQEYLVADLGRSLDTQEAPACADAPTYRPTGERLVSTTSSVDWKTRLSYDVEKTERSCPSPTRVSGGRSEVEYVIPTMPRAFGHGHIREAAQIGGYEEDEHNSTVRMPTNPMAPLGSVEPNIVKLSPQQRSVMQTTPPPAALLRATSVPASIRAVSSGEDEMPIILPEDAMRPRAAPLESNGAGEESRLAAVSQPQTPARGAHPVRQVKSLAHPQNFSRVRAEETGSPRAHGTPTVRLMRKAAVKMEPNSESTASAPGVCAAAERHFGSLPRYLGADVLAKENRSPHGETKDGFDAQDVSRGAKSISRGGKGMVEMFLNSRRRQRDSGDGPALV